MVICSVVLMQKGFFLTKETGRHPHKKSFTGSVIRALRCIQVLNESEWCYQSQFQGKGMDFHLFISGQINAVFVQISLLGCTVFKMRISWKILKSFLSFNRFFHQQIQKLLIRKSKPLGLCCVEVSNVKVKKIVTCLRVKLLMGI